RVGVARPARVADSRAAPATWGARMAHCTIVHGRMHRSRCPPPRRCSERPAARPCPQQGAPMNLAALVAQYGYAFVFLGALAEGESVLIVAGFAAHRGMLRLHEVMAVAFVASSLSDQLCFYMGRRHGPRLLARFPSLQPQLDRLRPTL